MACSECNKLREIVKKLKSNGDNIAPLPDQVLHCGCKVPELHDNNTGPANHKLCYKCVGWRRA